MEQLCPHGKQWQGLLFCQKYVMKWQMPGHCSYHKWFWLMLLVLLRWTCTTHPNSRFLVASINFSSWCWQQEGQNLGYMLEGLSSRWGDSGISSLWWTPSSALVLWCWHVEGQYVELLRGPVLWVGAPFPSDPLVLQLGEAVWTHPNFFPSCAFGCLSERNKTTERGFILPFGEDVWATLELRGHGLWEQSRFTGAGVWKGQQETGGAKTC